VGSTCGHTATPRSRAAGHARCAPRPGVVGVAVAVVALRWLVGPSATPAARPQVSCGRGRAARTYSRSNSRRGVRNPRPRWQVDQPGVGGVQARARTWRRSRRAQVGHDRLHRRRDPRGCVVEAADPDHHGVGMGEQVELDVPVLGHGPQRLAHRGAGRATTVTSTVRSSQSSRWRAPRWGRGGGRRAAGGRRVGEAVESPSTSTESAESRCAGHRRVGGKQGRRRRSTGCSAGWSSGGRWAPRPVPAGGRRSVRCRPVPGGRLGCLWTRGVIAGTRPRQHGHRPHHRGADDVERHQRRRHPSQYWR
jgi:hypothetical protein